MERGFLEPVDPHLRQAGILQRLYRGHLPAAEHQELEFLMGEFSVRQKSGPTLEDRPDSRR
jgi:hypothetical protein